MRVKNYTIQLILSKCNYTGNDECYNAQLSNRFFLHRRIPKCATVSFVSYE